MDHSGAVPVLLLVAVMMMMAGEVGHFVHLEMGDCINIDFDVNF